MDWNRNDHDYDATLIDHVSQISNSIIDYRLVRFPLHNPRQHFFWNVTLDKNLKRELG